MHKRKTKTFSFHYLKNIFRIFHMKNSTKNYSIVYVKTSTPVSLLCTYQCKSREGGVRARGGDLMPETIPMSGF